MAKKKQSALHEKKGVKPIKGLNPNAAKHIKSTKLKYKLDTEILVKGILKSDITALSQAITLVESTNPLHTQLANKIINDCLPYANKSIRIGITGVPGVGKSTFIETLGNYLLEQHKKIAVLAVDPTSTISKGSILGDKTRMEELVKSDNVFIRPSASGLSLGGVARKTRETIILCEAAGFNTIIIETVGVGQSETAVHSMVDFFLLLKLARAGDELQGIKRGIIEMADAIIINKADGDNLKHAKIAKTEFSRALHLYPEKKSGWSPKVKLNSSLQTSGIDSIWDMILEYQMHTKSNLYFEENRKAQNNFWLLQTINEQLSNQFYNHPKIKTALEQQKKLIKLQQITPFEAAEKLLTLYKSLD